MVHHLTPKKALIMPGMPDHNQEKLHDKLQLPTMGILLHAKSKPSTSNSF